MGKKRQEVVGSVLSFFSLFATETKIMVRSSCLCAQANCMEHELVPSMETGVGGCCHLPRGHA